MRRRGVLERLGVGTGAITVGALAGCLQDGVGGTDPEPDPDETGTIASKAITSTGFCAEGSEADQGATVSFTASGVEITGSVAASTPCFDAVFSTVEYATATELAVTIGLERQEGVCQDCLGRVDYAGTIEIDGTLPETVTVTHDHADGETEMTEETTENDAITASG